MNILAGALWHGICFSVSKYIKLNPMKNNTLLILSIYLLFSSFSFSQKLFNHYEMKLEDYNRIVAANDQININNLVETNLFLDLNHLEIDRLLNNNIDNIDVEIPFFNNQSLHLELSEFSVYQDLIKIKRQTAQGEKTEYLQPSFKTYKIELNEAGVNGTLIFSKKGVKGIIVSNNKTYQLMKLFKDLESNIYFLADVQDSPVPFDFQCGNGLLSQLPENIANNNFRAGGDLSGCIEIAMEIDYYTFQAFNNYQDAVDWALEIISVASNFYFSEIGIELKSNFAQIWEIEDPYNAFVEDPNNMLFAIRNHWNEQDALADVNRHIVHLFSRRSNTGTGGIAFLNGIGSAWNGYGFSSSLTDTEDYVDLPVPYFFWNIYCLMHELGHNFGAKHTQWCGWPEGPLDNCVNIEEVLPGECSSYSNNPSPEIGTIMSYCHMWPAQSGGGIIMKFHDTVKDALFAYIGMHDLDNCEEELIVEGCLDELACNYNLSANTEDNSCIYPELFYDCFGNCLNDENENLICDENENLSFGLIEENHHTLFYPNPATNYIRLKTDNLSRDVQSLHIVNILGQIVFLKSNIMPQEKIDISSVASGAYIAYLMDDKKIIKEIIIIQ